MIKSIFCIFIFISSSKLYCQNLVYKSNGNVRDTENNKISPDKVRALLASNQKLLAGYSAGRSKKTLGNILIIGGLSCIAGDLIREAFTPVDINNLDKKTYPSALTYLGAAAVLIAIPVKIGFAKKIKSSVDEYNKLQSERTTKVSDKQFEFIANNAGLGVRITIN